MAARIRLIEPSGFRGVRFAAPLIFGDEGSSAVVFGANGRGKSSYVDSLECYLFGRIGHLQREGVFRAAFRHRGCPVEDVAYVRVEFTVSDFDGRLDIDSERRLRYEDEHARAETFRQAASLERTILRHKELADFVDKTKTEKLEALAPLIGVQELSQVRGQLVRAVGLVEADLRAGDRAVQDRRCTVCSILEIDSFSEGGVWTKAAGLLGAAGSTASVSNLDELARALEAMPVAADSGRDRTLRALEEARSGVQSVRRVPLELAEALGFAAAFNSLLTSGEAVQQLQLVGVWRAGHEIVAASWWKQSRCPLCDQALDPAELLDRLGGLLLSAEETERRSLAMEEQRAGARQAIEGLRRTLRSAGASMGGIEACHALELGCAEAVDLLQLVDLELARALSSGTAVDTTLIESWASLAMRVQQEATRAHTAVDELVATTSRSPEERLRLESFGKLSALESDLRRLETLEVEAMEIADQLGSVKAVLEAFEEHERETIEGVLGQIAAHVSRYFQQLHQHESYGNVRLEFSADRRGVEFSLEAYGEHLSPPRLLLSESHMNSLGLCLFLAAAREFNTATRFIVLDDVVNSFDADHRCQLAELLVNEFQDFQILAFTHDPIWYEHLRRLGARWKAFTLGPWTYGLGVDILPPPAEALARVRAFIDRGEVDAAGNLARQLAEQRLKRLLSSLRAPVPYREGYDNDRRDLEELFRALRRHAKSSGRFSHRDSDAWDEFAASRFLANLASHDQPAMPAGLSGSDIEFFVTKLTELEALFRCEHCAKPVWQLRAEPNDDQSQCECGQLKI